MLGGQLPWGGPSPPRRALRNHHFRIARGLSMHEERKGATNNIDGAFALTDSDVRLGSRLSPKQFLGSPIRGQRQGRARSPPDRSYSSARENRGGGASSGRRFDSLTRRRHSSSRPDSAERARNIMRSQSCGPGHREHHSSSSSSLVPRGGAPRPKISATEMPPGAPAKLNLYHVSRPEPRARWMFNLSTHGAHKLNKRPESLSSAPTRVTSTIDESRPSLGGLVWVNATLGGHCCLQKGTKSKIVTDVPTTVLDGWLNGQTGFWWIGALKEGHRTTWDSHIVMSWAMVFIPSFPEVAARNNMEVWRDKCLKGSLRVARPGELARKIVDIVADDQDAEPESVVHTHLCILLAEGDDLDLRRPRMQGTTPRAGDTPGGSAAAKPSPFLSNGSANGAAGIRASSPAPEGAQRLTASKSMGNMTGPGIAPRTDLAAEGRSSSFPGNSSAAAEGAGVPGREGSWGGMTLEEALERVDRYRERIRVLKDDRQSKKAMLAHLKEELAQKEEMFTEENDRLRHERNELRTRAKMLSMDLESLQGETIPTISTEEVEQLQFDVERLRRERDDARAEAMRWLESEKAKLEQTAQVVSIGDPRQHSHSQRQSSRSRSSGGTGGSSEGKRDNAGKAQAAIAKLRAKVERLRKERDDAEEQAAKWLSEQQEKLKEELVVQGSDPPRAVAPGSDNAAGTASDGEAARPPSAAGAGDSHPSTPSPSGTRGVLAGGPVVASLRAESSKLKKELAEARLEAQRLKDKAAVIASHGGGIPRAHSSSSVGGGLAGFTSVSMTESASSSANPEEASAQAKKALGQLLGKALNLLSPKAAAEAAAEVAAKAAANAEAAAANAENAGGSDLGPASEIQTEVEEVAPASEPVQGWGHSARKGKEENEESGSVSSTVHNSPPATAPVTAQTPRSLV